MDYDRVVLDIEGTVCPLSFVKDELFPYFLQQLPTYLEKYDFPLTASCQKEKENDPILEILIQFPESTLRSSKSLSNHISDLVKNDIKDPILKQLQGFIWEQGYTTGSIMAPLFDDAIKSMKLWSNTTKGLYIYSSGSVKAQKLLFGNVRANENESCNLNRLIEDYFDTVNIGKKTEVQSYKKILKKITSTENEKVLFLSDNPLEVNAAIKAGMISYIVDKPGNHPLSIEDKKAFKIIKDLDEL